MTVSKSRGWGRVQLQATIHAKHSKSGMGVRACMDKIGVYISKNVRELG